MKTNPRKPKSPDTDQDRLRKAIPHTLRLTVFGLALLLLLSLFHLALIGLPGGLTRRISKRLQDAGLPVRIEAITLSPHHGLALHNVQLYSPFPDDLKPLLQADKLFVLVWPERWNAPFRSGWNISASAKKMTISPGIPWRGESRLRFGTIDRASCRLQVDDSGLQLSRSEIIWGGTVIRAQGSLAFSQADKPLDPSRYFQMRSRILQAANALCAIEFEPAAALSIDFDIPLKPQTPSIRARLQADSLYYKQTLVGRLLAETALSNGTLHVDPFLPSEDDTQFELAASCRLADQQTTCRITNTLEAASLLGMLPPAASGVLDRAGLKLPGSFDFDATLGPAPAKNLAEQIRFNLRQAQAVRNDISLDPVSAQIIRNGSRIEITDIQAQANGGPLKGNVAIDLDTRAWNANLSGDVIPNPIGNLLPPSAKDWIDRLAFSTNKPPHLTVNLQSTGEKGSLTMDGTVEGSEFTCGGFPFDSVHTGMAYADHRFTLGPLHVLQSERELRGSVSVNFREKNATFSATNSIAPSQIANVIAPDVPTILDRFTFDGPIRSEASGRIDYSGGSDHSFSGWLAAEDITFHKFRVDTFDSQIIGNGAELIFTNATAQLLGGSAEGSGRFDLTIGDSKVPYSLSLEAKRLDLPELQKVVATNSGTRTTGKLSMRVNFTADGEAGFWASTDGNGSVEILDGRLAEFPLMGGFSRLIRSTLPAFSLFSLTTLYSDFELRDGGIHTRSLQLGGTLLTVEARGAYSPAGGLNFKVVVEPFNRSRKDKEWYHIVHWGTEAIKQGTAPLFKLIEFQLTGSLDDPKWKLR